MFSLASQKYFLQKGLNLKDVFLLSVLQSLIQPITLNKLLARFPILDIKHRQYTLILEKLERANCLIREPCGTGSFFRFPFVTLAKNCQCHPFDTSKNMLQLQTKLSKKMLHKTQYINNNNNKHYYNKNIHIVVDTDYLFGDLFSLKKETTKQRAIKKAFKTAFPKKNNFIKDRIPKGFDVQLLIEKIKESKFLRDKEFINLNWCLKNYSAIISDYYKSYYSNKSKAPPPKTDTSFSQREYTREELNSLFDFC